MDERLRVAAQNGDTVSLYQLISQDPFVLERIDAVPFEDTPLHIAASAGRTHFAMEIASLKPSFGTKLNRELLSPLHLALRNGQNETVRALTAINPELIRVKGLERVSPLHYVASTENTNILAEFLFACPEAIKDLTIHRETALHIAVRTRKIGTFRVLHGWIKWTNREQILDWKDEEGNTVLHIAAYTNQPEACCHPFYSPPFMDIYMNFSNYLLCLFVTYAQVVKLLLYQGSLFSSLMDLNAKNLDGLTALDIALLHASELDNRVTQMLRRGGAVKASLLCGSETLADFLSVKFLFHETWVRSFCCAQASLCNKSRDLIIVVAVLIATATFQAAVSLPGGIFAGVDNTPTTSAGTNTTQNVYKSLKYGAEYILVDFFTFASSTAFSVSIGVIYLTVKRHPFSLMLPASLVLLFVSYCASAVLVLPDDGFLTYFIFPFQILLLGGILFFGGRVSRTRRILRKLVPLHTEIE
ncbi:ankyrin repeat-containing protein BDA1-like [Malania oleifera]|uniref:ankyrin repeat-containing protein BDA1-like n=1 Tax=Malania oleifera TaxID=397392 RepID=UPI0025AE06E7|nr:ankyrin repeat-containing protein BDA1-like [Malania oleifera]